MKLYSCKVRLGGSVLNEVRKTDVTKAEISILRALHGTDAVSEVLPNGSVARDADEERTRLESIYLGGSDTTRAKVAEMLGPRVVNFEDSDAPAAEEDEAPDEPPAPPVAPPAAPARGTLSLAKRA